MRRDYGVHGVVRACANQSFKADILKNDLALRVGKNGLGDPVTPVASGMDQPIRGNAVLQHFAGLRGVPLLLRKVADGCDDEAEIADAGHVEARSIDFIENAVADREPDATARVGRRSNCPFCA